MQVKYVKQTRLELGLNGSRRVRVLQNFDELGLMLLECNKSLLDEQSNYDT